MRGRVGWEGFGWLDAGDYTTGSGGCQEKCGNAMLTKADGQVLSGREGGALQRYRDRYRNGVSEVASGELTRADSQVASGSHMDTSSGRGSRVMGQVDTQNVAW